MDVQKLASNGIATAFRMLSKSAVDAPLRRKTSASFDFSSGSVQENVESSTVRAIDLKVDKTSKTSNTVMKQILVKSSTLSDLSLYDSINLGGLEWTLGKPVLSENSFMILEVYRELPNG